MLRQQSELYIVQGQATSHVRTIPPLAVPYQQVDYVKLGYNTHV